MMRTAAGVVLLLASAGIGWLATGVRFDAEMPSSAQTPREEPKARHPATPAVLKGQGVRALDRWTAETDDAPALKWGDLPPLVPEDGARVPESVERALESPPLSAERHELIVAMLTRATAGLCGAAARTACDPYSPPSVRQLAIRVLESAAGEAGSQETLLAVMRHATPESLRVAMTVLRPVEWTALVRHLEACWRDGGCYPLPDDLTLEGLVERSRSEEDFSLLAGVIGDDSVPGDFRTSLFARLTIAAVRDADPDRGRARLDHLSGVLAASSQTMARDLVRAVRGLATHSSDVALWVQFYR